MVMVMVVVQATLGILYLPVFSHGDWHPKSWGTYIKLVAAAAAAAAGVNLLAIKIGCGSGRAGAIGNVRSQPEQHPVVGIS
jgi:uncharacterized membrane protein (DUF2068 family)